MISGFLRVVTLKLPGGGFCLARFSPFVNKLPYSIYFPLHLVFLVICWYFHNLHAIELNLSTWVIKLIKWVQAILTQHRIISYISMWDFKKLFLKTKLITLWKINKDFNHIFTYKWAILSFYFSSLNGKGPTVRKSL